MLYNQQTKQTKHKATPAPENIATRLKGPVRDPTKKQHLWAFGESIWDMGVFNWLHVSISEDFIGIQGPWG